MNQLKVSNQCRNGSRQGRTKPEASASAGCITTPGISACSGMSARLCLGNALVFPVGILPQKLKGNYTLQDEGQQENSHWKQRGNG
jgi:hypothetical protein